MQHQNGYVEFYDRVIQQHTVGFKLVPGGTGNGKTSAFSQVVKLEQLKDADSRRQFLYVPNRVQLLAEMAHQLNDASIPFIHLRRDVELVIALLQSHELRDAFDRLLRPPTIAAALRAVDQSSNGTLGSSAMRQAITEIERLLPHAANDAITTILDDHARIIMRTMQRALREAAKDSTETEQSRTYRRLTADPAVRHLFPYITFRETKTPVLLVTLQKLFQGFFDGRKMVNLSQLKGPDSGYVILLDEFDFLESNLTELICNDTEITAPFAFVESFYQTMTRHKLPLPEYPAQGSDTRARIERIITDIDMLRERGLNFPAINQFTCSDRDEVAFRHFAMHTTPEKLILTLATHSLVFGLSATADIPRCVRAFNLDWLRQQEGFNYLPTDQREYEIIARLNANKQMSRNNRIGVAVADTLVVAQELVVFAQSRNNTYFALQS